MPDNLGPPIQPATPVTLADCKREGWVVTANCEPCRRLTVVDPDRFDPDTARHPLADAWAEGWIACTRCRQPYEGLQVEDRGNASRPARVIEECYLPGAWPDPECRRRWRQG